MVVQDDDATVNIGTAGLAVADIDPALDIVVGVADGAAAALHHASMTGRRCVLADDPGELSAVIDAGPRSCVVSGGAALTTGHIVDISAGAVRANVQVGFVHGWAGAEAARAHADRVARYRAAWPESILLWSTFPGLPPVDGGEPRIRCLDWTDETLVPALMTGHRLVCIESHGNGVDAELVGDRVLCVRQSMGSRRPLRSSMPCLHGGQCLQTTDGRIDEARMVAPESIKADVLVWSTCWGVLAADAPFDPAVSLATRIAASANVGTVLTTVTSVVGSPDTLLGAAALLAEGRTVGELCLLLNGRVPDDAAPPWLVLGDPFARAFPLSRLAEIDVTHASRRLESLPDGLFRIRPRDGAGGVATGVIGAAPVAGDGRRMSRPHFARQLTGDGYLGLYAGPAPDGYTVAVTDLGALPEWTALRELARRVTGLGFLLAFPRWAGRGGVMAGEAVSADLTELAERTMVSTLRLAALPEPSSTLGGDATRVTRLLRQQRRNWRRLTELAADYFDTFLSTASGVLTHTYGPYASYSQGPPGRNCPYCGGAVESDRYRLPTASVSRTVLRCLACTNVADLPEGWVEAVIEGDGDVVAGGEFSVRVTAVSATDREADSCRIRVGVQRTPVPPGVDMLSNEPLQAGRSTTFGAVVRLRVSPDAQAGAYFAVAVIVVDGDVLVTRRPIRIRAGSR